MTLIEQIQNLLRSVTTDPTSGGQFKEVVAVEDGRQIVYEFPLATGMAWGAKKSTYSSLFGEPPYWVSMLHPAHRIRLCDLSLDAGKPLPQEIERQIITLYLAKGQIPKGRSQVPTLQDANDSNEERLMSKPGDEDLLTEFEVDNSGTLTMANFWEPQIRSEFYESVSVSWSESPAHLADAMDECQPLSWAVHAIYTEIRDEIESDLDGVTRSSGVHKKRSGALKARLKAMPEEPEEGAEDWLLALTSSEFEERVVPEIEQWFAALTWRRYRISLKYLV